MKKGTFLVRKVMKLMKNANLDNYLGERDVATWQSCNKLSRK